MLTGNVPLAYMYELTLDYCRFPAARIVNGQTTLIQTLTQIKRLSVRQDVDAPQVKQVPVVDPEGGPSQFGRLTRSSCSTDRPSIVEVSRL